MPTTISQQLEQLVGDQATIRMTQGDRTLTAECTSGGDSWVISVHQEREDLSQMPPGYDPDLPYPGEPFPPPVRRERVEVLSVRPQDMAVAMAMRIGEGWELLG